MVQEGRLSKPVGSIPPEPLIRFLPPGSSLEFPSRLSLRVDCKLQDNKPLPLGFGQCFITAIEGELRQKAL